MSKKNQQGSAHLTVIIILVAVILGLLGFVFYQNFMQQPIQVTDNSILNTSETPVISEVDPNTFTITQWGIKGIYDGQYTLEYTLKTAFDSSDYIALTSPDVDQRCLGRELLLISKYSANDVIGGHGHLAIENPKTAAYFYSINYFKDEMVKAGDNYYVLDQGVTDSCPGDGTTVEDQLLSDIKKFFSTLQVI